MQPPRNRAVYSALTILILLSALNFASIDMLAVAQSPPEDTPLSITINPIAAANGHAMLLQVDARHRQIDHDSFVVHLQNRRIPLAPHPARPKGHFFALIGVSYYASPGTSALLLEWHDQFGDHLQTVPYQVVDGRYRSERLTVSSKKVRPSSLDIERIRREKAGLKRIYAASRPQRLWNEPFGVPVDSKVTSQYGSKRLFNGTLKSYHNGTDFKAAVGTPVYAANAGIVRMAEELFFSGKLVIIDHGLGMFTQYAHLSDMQVQPGQRVEKGQRIGLSGKTGRITGPHLHWGVKLNGVNVDPIQLINVTRLVYDDAPGDKTVAEHQTAVHPPAN